MEHGRVLLGQDFAQLRVGVLGPCEDGSQARVWRIEEGDLIAGEGVDERREEGRLSVREVECEVLDVVADACQGINLGLLCEGVGVEGDVDASEEWLGEGLAVGRRGGPEGANVRGREVREEVVLESITLQE